MKKLRIYLSLLSLVFFCSTIFAQGQGFTVTSVSTSSVITNTTNLAQTYWIINTQFTGGGQAITGTISPETIKSLNPNKLKSKKALNITAEAVTETATYDVINEGVQIYKYNVTHTEGEVSCPLGICYVVSDAPACPSGTNWDIPSGLSFWGKVKYRFCISKTQVATKGVYTNPTINFNAKISLSNGDSTVEKTVCSGAVTGCDGSSISLDDIGVATWTGSLVTGDAAPNQDNFVAMLTASAHKWQTVRRSTFEAYFPTISTADALLTQYKNSNAFQYYEDLSSGLNLITQAVTPANTAADNLLLENVALTSTPYNKDEYNTGKLSIPLTRKLTSPNVVFRIRADWIGVVIPTGKPNILNVTTTKFKSGVEGEMTVQLQNIGDVQGTFAVALKGCEPFVQVETSQSLMKTVQPGAVETINLHVTGGNISTDFSQNCQVRVYEVNDPSIEAFYSINLQLEKADICVPGAVSAVGNLIKRCRDGKTYDTEKCESGVVSDGYGGYACAPEISKEQNLGCNSDGDCQSTEYCHADIRRCVQRSGCLNIVNNGDSSKKIDVAFVGDEFYDNEELRQAVLQMVDFEGTNNGLMSVEPFKSNKNKFNIWIVKGGYIEPGNAGQPINGSPDLTKALGIAAQCTNADYLVVLSRKEFTSHAYLFTGYALLSVPKSGLGYWANKLYLGGSYGGRLLLHEFGHSFGNLADEYIAEGYSGRAGVNDGSNLNKNDGEK